MKVLVACEESQVVCKAFRAKGHEAYSNDIIDCSGGHPEWHLKMDALEAIHLMDWDLMIGHPPCTYISNSGVCWLYNKDGSKNEERWEKMRMAAAFFKSLLNAPIPVIVIENPIPHKYAVELIGRKYDQLVQPYMFGEPESKATCFWLKGVDRIDGTNNVKHIWKSLPKNQGQRLHYLPPGPERAKLRSKTYQGIAEAMADQ